MPSLPDETAELRCESNRGVGDVSFKKYDRLTCTCSNISWNEISLFISLMATNTWYLLIYLRYLDQESSCWVHDFMARPFWRSPFCCGPFLCCPFVTGSFWSGPFLREFHENNFFLLLFVSIFLIYKKKFPSFFH